MITKANSNYATGRVRVTFSVPQSVCAEQIELVIAKNDDLDIRSFHLAQSGDWSLSLNLLAGCVYRFQYLYDGWQWVSDDSADGFVRNPLDNTLVCLLDTNINNAYPHKIVSPYSTLAALSVTPEAEFAGGR
jgi:hypothetical protein